MTNGFRALCLALLALFACVAYADVPAFRVGMGDVGLPGNDRAMSKKQGGGAGPIAYGTTLTTPNGTYAADHCFVVNDISGTTWTAAAGDNLTKTGSGTDPVVSSSDTPFTDGAQSIYYATSGGIDWRGNQTAFVPANDDFVAVGVFKWHNAGGNETITDWGITGSFDFRQSTTVLQGRTTRSGSTIASSNGPVEADDDAWHIMIVTGDASEETTRLYYDGSFDEEDTGTGTGQIGASGESLILGTTTREHSMAWYCFWSGTNMFDNDTEENTTAADLYAAVLPNGI